MQEFWISKTFVPKEHHSNDSHACMKVFIPNECVHCNHKLIITYGNHNDASHFADACYHFFTYTNVWENRIKISIKLDPKDDGVKCKKCGNFAHMAISNQNDGSFICYSCRQIPW